MEHIKSTIKKQVEKIISSAITFRRHLHENPELSEQEFKTAQYISQHLKSWGIEHTIGIAKTGIKAVIHSEKGKGKVVGLRCDMDALPIEEKTLLDYASKNRGVMHACGHDMHMAVLLATAYVLNQLKSEFTGSVVFIFQPSEEKYPGGAIRMINEGVLENPKVNVMFGMHVLPELQAGIIGFKSGKYMASTDEVYITVFGKGGHGATPQQNIDPVTIAAQILLSLQQIVSRLAPPQIPTVLSFGKFEALGSKNIIPDTAKLEGTFRTFDELWQKKAHQLIGQICQQTASAFGAECKVTIDKGYPFLHNDVDLTNRAISYATNYFGSKNIVELDMRTTSEDFSYFAQNIPSCFYRIGVGFEHQKPYNLHASDFQINEDAITNAIEMMCYLTICELNRK